MPQHAFPRNLLLHHRPYGPPGVRFDGTSSYLVRGALLTGVADSKVGLFSTWFNLVSVESTLKPFTLLFNLTGALTTFIINIEADNVIRLFGRNAAGTTILLQKTAQAFTATNRWNHIAMWWNLATPAAGIYVNGVSDTVSTTLTDDTIDYAPVSGDWGVGVSIGAISAPTAGTYFPGRMAQFYFNPAATLDLSVESNLRKLITKDRRPMYLGATGELVTGTAPAVFLNSPISTWPTNLGSGGGFTLNGPLTASQTRPPSTWGG